LFRPFGIGNLNVDNGTRNQGPMDNILQPPKRDDDDDLVIGGRAMAEVATAEGFSLSAEWMTRLLNKPDGAGPEVIGRFGKRHVSTKGRVRTWCWSRIQPLRPGPMEATG
jgi:hypothetical protein